MILGPDGTQKELHIQMERENAPYSEIQDSDYSPDYQVFNFPRSNSNTENAMKPFTLLRCNKVKVHARRY